MLNKLLANKGFCFDILRKTCSGCGADSILAARFCGRCGLRLRKQQIFKGLRKRHLMFAATSIFFMVALITFAILKMKQPVYADGTKFDDIPVDHQVYSQCRNLLAFDGVRLRTRKKFSPYLKISADEFNHAFLAAIRFNRCRFEEQMLIKEKQLEPEAVYKRFRQLAQLSGRQGQLRQVEKSAFADLSRFNQLSLIERVFMRRADVQIY